MSDNEKTTPPAQDPLKGLSRLGDEALGPCCLCGRVMLETEFPIFYRIRIHHCGIDFNAVRSRVGMAMQLGGGAQGLALASALGPQEKPVVEVSSKDANVCMSCAQQHPGLMQVLAGEWE